MPVNRAALVLPSWLLGTASLDMEVETCPHKGMTQGSPLWVRLLAPGTLGNQTNFGDQLAVSLRFWVLKGVSHLFLRGFPRAGCGQAVWKSPFNINVPIAFVIKSVRNMAYIHNFLANEGTQ